MGHPTVEVTLLFTDIEGSTALAHELGDGYVEVLAQHNRIIRDAIGLFTGVEARNEGDAFFAAFDRAEDAVDAALNAQRCLAAYEWSHGRPVRVRMGLHTGPVIRLLHDFAGLNVHLASRISGAAHGGQVVASQAVLDALDPGAYAWTELGAHIVKDFPEPITLFQLRADGLDTKFPPLVAIDARDHNLPAIVTSFVGRQDELADLRTLLLGDARLVTLTGPGGVGKTRLAVEATWSVLSRFRSGAWFVDFAAVSDPGLILDTIAGALGVRDRDDATPRDLIAERFAAAPGLLVLDNLEHLLSGVVAISDLLTVCPKLVVLATTRERLRLQGEHEMLVDGLADDDAAQLFAARAALVRRDFVVDERVHELCERVGRLPLAIELAAARLRTESVDALVAAMDSMLDTLSEGERDRPARHQAMRAAIAVSVNSLTEAERSVFRALSVFAGGATRDAIEAVCAPKADEVQSLSNKSLLRASGDRFVMLEPIRQFAQERLALDVPGEHAQRVQAHAQFFVEFAERLEPDLVTASQREALDRLDAEHANLRLAWERGDGDVPIRVASAMGRFWIRRGHPHEGRAVLRHVLEADHGSDSKVRAKALLASAQLALLQHELDDARSLLADVLISGDLRERAAAENLLGETDRLAGRLDEAEAHYLEATRLAEESDDVALLGFVRNNQAAAAYGRRDFVAVAGLAREALALSEETGDLQARTRAMGNLGAALRALGQSAEAVSVFESSLALATELGDREGQARAMHNIAAAMADAADGVLDSDRLSLAKSYVFKAIEIFDALGYRREMASALLGLPRFSDDVDASLRVIERARMIFSELGDESGVGAADAMRETLLACSN